MKVLKFGGASVGSAEKIANIVRIVAPDTENVRAVVVSAFDGVTDQLIKASDTGAKGDDSYCEIVKQIEERHVESCTKALPPVHRARTIAHIKSLIHELEDVLKGAYLTRECTPRTKDYVMSFGERLSAYLLTETFLVNDVWAEFLDARRIICTDRNFGAGQVLVEATNDRIREFFSEHKALQIVTGFIASTEEGETTTLGRGGSDYTAALLGAALSANEIEIWTDVDGVMTADPRHVPGALCLKALTYEEALELTHFGAKVIYPPTIQPAYEKKIPLRIRNTFNVEHKGTLVSSEPVQHSFLVTGISSIDHIAFVRVEGAGMIGVVGIAKRVFGVLAENKINVILITQASSEHTICFAIPPGSAQTAKSALEREFEVEISRGFIEGVTAECEFSIVSAVGENMRRTPGIAGRLFGALGRNGVNVVAIAQGSSELSVSVVISRRDQKKALQAIHDEFFLSDVKAAHLFLVGKGRIGGTLLGQLKAQHDLLHTTEGLDLRLVGFKDSTRLLINERGVSPDSALEELKAKGIEGSLHTFIERILELNLPHTIFVDCTASAEVPKVYPTLLSKSVSIVTPNKHSVAEGYLDYKGLKDLVKRRSALFLFETCVGAGLPVISTLNDLLKSGDKIRSIEAVLSGTLSFIFNSFTPGKRFSQLVREAHSLGYTEPDPREDLSGLDVARKLLILAREIGLPLEGEEVEIENLVPQECRDQGSLDDFFAAIERVDNRYEELNRNAAVYGQRLCYIASLREGKARTALETIGPEHPFFGLSGADNVISFVTDRYSHRPLVVKGPGAGPDVTAAGVFADIIRIANQA